MANIVGAAARVVPAPIRRVARQWHRESVLRRALRELARDPERALSPDRRLLRSLVYGWGNPWSAQEEYLAACVAEGLSCRGPILECGSGLTTLVLGVVAARVGVPLHALEHDPAWGVRVAALLDRMDLTNATVHVVSLKKWDEFDWYALPEGRLPEKFHMVVCDGPPGTTRGGRYGLMPVLGSRLVPGAVIMLDDGERPDEQDIAARWSRESGATYQLLGTEKPFIRLVLPGAE